MPVKANIFFFFYKLYVYVFTSWEHHECAPFLFCTEWMSRTVLKQHKSICLTIEGCSLRLGLERPAILLRAAINARPAHPTQHSSGMTTTQVIFPHRSKRKHACSSSSLEPRCSGWVPRILSKQPCGLLLSFLVGYWAYFCSSFIPASFALNSFIITVAAHSPVHHKNHLRCQP
jgi:hypothetical protein